MNVDGKEGVARWGLPGGNKRLSRTCPSFIRRIDPTGIESVASSVGASITCREIRVRQRELLPMLVHNC